MMVAFESLAGDSRIWVYQLDRKLKAQEEQMASDTIRTFCDQWLAHGAPLRASYKIFHGQLVVLSVDQKVTDASGCSIDGSVRTLKAIGEKLAVDFFDRTQVAFLIGGEVRLFGTKELKDAFASGIISADTLTFNPQVSAKNDLENSWIVPAGKTWLNKFLPKSALA
jgi:hypothetical protein